MNFEKEINIFIENNDKSGLKKFMADNDLILQDGVIVHSKKGYAKEQSDFWKQRQQARKILLNSLYGAILNEGFRMFDQRMGQSVTLTGRSITKHMISKVNEVITNKYDVEGDAIVYSDTDSVASDTVIDTSNGKMTVEKLFNSCKTFYNEGTKEYGQTKDIKVLSFDPSDDSITYKNFNYIYRHKVSKKRFKINVSNGNSVIVTEDHSIMIERNNKLIEVKPIDIKNGDIVISYK